MLSIEPGDEPDVVVEGSFGGGVESRTSRSDDTVDVRLALPVQSPMLNPRFPWAWGLVVDWDLMLTRAIPIDLEIDISGGRGAWTWSTCASLESSSRAPAARSS